METFAKLVVSTAELFEAEGRMLRRQVVKLTMLAALVPSAILTVMVGVGFVVAGVFHALSQQIGTTWSAVIVGAACIIAGLFAARHVRQLMQ